MDAARLLRRLRNREQAALEEAIAQYGSYVAAILRNRGCGQMSRQDVEELSSDVFLTLWQRAGEIRAGRLKPWLGQVARNRAVDWLRRQQAVVPLDEQGIVVEDSLWEGLSARERAQAVRDAMNRLDSRDREIFYRYYDLCQTSREIAQAMGMPDATVRTRLARGRRTLKQYLQQGGILDEAAF